MMKLLATVFATIILSACSEQPAPEALGTLERDRITLTTTASEIIRELPVKEGNTVKRGQVLVKLDTRNQEARLAHAMAQQAKSKAMLAKLTNGEREEDIAAAAANVTQAQTKLTEAEHSYQRVIELVQQNYISESEKDSALAARDSAKAALDSAQEQYRKLTAGARFEDIEQASAELTSANADVALQQQLLAELTITATRDGILDNLPYNLGERVPKNAIVAVVQANRTPYARVYVPASHRLNFISGRTIDIRVDGYPSAIEGTIRWVSSAPSFTPYYALTENERSRLMYLAEIDLTDEAATLPSGIPAQAILSSLSDD